MMMLMIVLLLLRIEMVKRFWIHGFGFIVGSEVHILLCRGSHHILHFQLSIANCALMLASVTMAPGITLDDFHVDRVTGRFIEFA